MAKTPVPNDVKTWQFCYYCPLEQFKTAFDFTRHLRERHCTQEGGSFVCRYGYNGVCSSLPMDGVNDRDYESHVNRCHVQPTAKNPAQWSVFSSSQNLPAVLNDPGRGKQTNLFTKKWGDSFVDKVAIPATPYLDDIGYEDFEPYIQKIGKRFRRHIRLSQTGNHSDRQSGQQATDNNLRTINERNDASLNDIPNIFTREVIDLNNPTTFALVFPGLEKRKKDSTQSTRLLQEKLSHYLDIVEDQISKQVSQKSSAFFHAMTSQDTIMEEMKAATENVKNLREKMKELEANLVKDSLVVLHMHRCRNNNSTVLEKLKLMATVHQTQPMIQLLLGTQDYVAALDLISTTQEILIQELVGIHCFKYLPSQLMEIERLIDKMLTTDFERYSTADLNRPLIGYDEDHKIIDEDKLICIISGLLRQKNFSFIDLYKEEAICTIKAVLKQMVIEIIVSRDSDMCLTGAGEEAQSLTIIEWARLLKTATANLLVLLKRIKSVQIVMQNTSDASTQKSIESASEVFESEAFLSSPDHIKVNNKLKDMMQYICNYCHERCANLISKQSLEDNIATAEQLAELTAIVHDFCSGCEYLCGAQMNPLNAALRVQGNRFSQKFHSDRKSKLALLLDSERWKQADVPAEFQTMIDSISQGDFSKSEETVYTPASNVLMVDGEPYVLVGAALIFVQIISEYCRCANQLPIIAPQLSRDVIDLMRTFNSRCCQLVLGTGALQKAGLKTITSGNLALVSRALQLVLWLLPHVRTYFQAFEKNGQTTNALSGYDRIEKDFLNHIKEIESKVSNIVCTLINNELSNWNARPPVPSQSFRNISRHLIKLNEVIASILPPPQIHQLYRTVQRSFKDKLRELLLKYNIINNGGPQHGTVTSELTFYMETLRSIKALPTSELVDDTIDDIWLK